MVTMASSAPCAASTSDVSTTTLPKKSTENRRSNKPIMEKRRRARINNCLNELKALILDAMKKDPARHSKLEKADILEMTVKHLESLQRQQTAITAVTDPQVLNKFKAGFTECAGEVGRFPGLDAGVKRRLLQHLATCLNTTPVAMNGSVGNIDSPNITSQQNVQVHVLPSENTVTTRNGIFFSSGATAGVQLVPTRLPNGDIALVLPNIQQRLQSSPSPSSSSSSPPPLAMLTPSRTASTCSATSSNSPIGFERLSVNIPSSTTMTDDSSCHSPTSMHSTYSSSLSPMNGTHSLDYDVYNNMPYSPPDQMHNQEPLSLVVRESYMQDEKPWRPWKN